MTGDHDRQRREKLNHVLPAQDQRQLRDKEYQAMLKRARNSDLSHVAARRICAPGGTDKMGRRVFSITCKNVTEDLDRNEVIMSVLNTMDNIVNKPYIVVCYFTQSSLGVGSSLLKNVFEHVDGRYRANLKHVYTVHASVLGKVSSWFSAVTSGESSAYCRLYCRGAGAGGAASMSRRRHCRMCILQSILAGVLWDGTARKFARRVNRAGWWRSTKAWPGPRG